MPKVTRVPSYNTDYLPTFREPNTYIRGRGAPRSAKLVPAVYHICLFHTQTDAMRVTTTKRCSRHTETASLPRKCIAQS